MSQPKFATFRSHSYRRLSIDLSPRPGALPLMRYRALFGFVLMASIAVERDAKLALLREVTLVSQKRLEIRHGFLLAGTINRVILGVRGAFAKRRQEQA